MARVSLGGAPPLEDNIVPDNDKPYINPMRKRALVWKAQLERTLPPPTGGSLSVGWFDSDSGPYAEVLASFNPDNVIHTAWVNDLLDVLEWDDASRRELGLRDPADYLKEWAA